jgi:N6-adenosine-specific RNA methylase IME4
MIDDETRSTADFDHDRVARSTFSERKLSEITVGERHRKKLLKIDELAASITDVGGLLHPIVIRPDGRLVAGGRRLAAVRQLGWEKVPVHVVTSLDETLALLKAERDENVCRVGFEISEAVAMGEMIAEIERPAAKERQRRSPGRPANGQPKTSGKLPDVSKGDARDRIAAAVGMSGKTYERAKKVIDAAEREPERFGHLKAEMDRTRRVNGVYKKLEREQLVDQINREPPPLPNGPFRVLVVDPPWNYGRPDDQSHRAANPYPSMTIQELCALDVPGIAHPDCVLWLWSTNGFMREAFQLLDAWGFTQKTILTWVKDKMGLGDWLRGKTEHCLLAIRGKPKVDLANQTTALIAPAGRHSAKPEAFYQLVEDLCPGSKAELFARCARKGWQQHGTVWRPP